MATVIGIPVYLHYCGGELEEISYLTKANSCCGEEEEETEDNGCCKNESHILLNSADFSLNTISCSVPTKASNELFYHTASASLRSIDQVSVYSTQWIESPPPHRQHDLMLASTLLRI